VSALPPPGRAAKGFDKELRKHVLGKTTSLEAIIAKLDELLPEPEEGLLDDPEDE